MAVLKCKMCGGDIELSADKTIGVCDSCGSTMTFPKVDDEQRANMFNRGNHFRRTGEFDKALAVYERIVQEDENDAEAHWCCALCRFGIEYVEDPNTFEFVPTCHRASFDSFLEDVDYLAAIEHSDGITRRQYQKDAAKIAEVQRGILATSQNEEPFDVFICYKESENDGSRTRDSLLAQEIYYQLTEQGRRVFFSRITLEDKAGTEYEPYIFAALNSAKVMILVTTSEAHANAVWVKNEWSRFLSLMRKDRSKLLLPCYRDMDPYDLPEALSVLQSYDMSKIGFIQDLTRGVNKVLNAGKPKETVKETVVVQQGNANAAPLLERAFMFLEDGDFVSANEYCEKVLDIDPKNAAAYLGKLMAEMKTRKPEQLKNCPQPFDTLNNYQKAIRFGDDALKKKLTDAVAFIKDRNETARKEGIYRNALAEMHKKTEQGCRTAASQFDSIRAYKDAQEKSAACISLAEETRKEEIYSTALSEMQKGSYHKASSLFDSIKDFRDAEDKIRECAEKAEEARKDFIYGQAFNFTAVSQLSSPAGQIERLEKAIERFRTIPGWRDTDAQIVACEKRIEEIKAKEEADRIAAAKRKRTRKIVTAIALSVLAAGIAFAVVLFTVILPKQRYTKAMELYNAGKYEEAIAAFEAMNGYRDSETQIESCKTAIKDRQYDAAITMYYAGEYDQAILVFSQLNGHRDSKARIEACETAKKERDYDAAVALYEAGQYEEAIAAFEALSGYKDSNTQIEKCVAAINDPKYDAAVALYNAGEYEIAIEAFKALNGYRDSSKQVDLCKTAIKDREYDAAMALYQAKKYREALAAFRAQNGYKDSDSYLKKCWDHIAVRSTIAAGGDHTVGLRSDGTVVAAGSNGYGQCGVSGWKDIAAIAAGDYHTVGLKSDGTVVAVGRTDYGQCDVSGWTDIVAIAAGSFHTVGLRLDGTVVAVGYNTYGQCDTSGWTDIVAIAAGSEHTVGLKSDGTVVAVGSNTFGKCDVSDWTDIVAIAARDYHTVGLKANGTVVAVGDNGDGQCGVSGWRDIVAIAAGSRHTVGLKSDGTVAAVGRTDYGRCNVSGWTDIVAIAAGTFHTVGLKSDGTVVAVGRTDYGQCDVSGWKNIKLPKAK